MRRILPKRYVRLSLLILAGLGVVGVSADANAHLGLLEPVSRYGTDVLKQGPCGMAGGARSANVVTLAPGATLTVRWDEYINHPGHFRIAFDDDGDDDFQDPPCLSNCDARTMVIGVAPADYTDATVLADGIADMAGGEYSYTVTLPNVECANCTLQVIQIMTDKPPYESPGNDIYYQCIDLVLTGGSGVDSGVVVVDGGSGPTDGGGGPADGGGGGGGGGDGGGCGCAVVGEQSDGSPLAPLGAVGLLVFTLVRSRRRRSSC